MGATGGMLEGRSALAVSGSGRKSLLSVVLRWRTYARLLYLLIGLPLGVLYWWVIFTVLPLSAALATVGIGVPLLVYALSGVWILIGIERELAAALLGEEMPVVRQPDFAPRGHMGQLRGYAGSRATWVAIAFLVVRLPLSVLSVSIALAAIGFASTLAAAPLTVWVTDINLGVWRIDTPWEALAAFFLGLPAGVGALHIVERTAAIYARLARSTFAVLNGE